MIPRQAVRQMVMPYLSVGSAAICLFILGCGGSSGPPRYPLSGTVTFKGKPIPVGMIYFIPDSAKGNEGPGSGAEIKDGRYATPSGKGVIGGPMIIKIDGYDGVKKDVDGETLQQGSMMFATFETNADLEKKSSKKDFDVDKEGSLVLPANQLPWQ